MTLINIKRVIMNQHSEVLKSMLQDIIAGNMDQAKVSLHNYFVSKTQEASDYGFGKELPADTSERDDSDFI
jgi:hypothetical protein